MNLLSRPSPEMNARKKILSRSDEQMDGNAKIGFFERPKREAKTQNNSCRDDDDFEKPKREVKFANSDDQKNEFERSNREAKSSKNVDRNDDFEKANRETKISNIEETNEDNFERPKREVKFQKSSSSQRPKTTTAFLLDFQRKIVQRENVGDRRPRRIENESRQTSIQRNENPNQEPRQTSRQRNGKMIRAKSLSQLLLPPRESPKRNRKLEKAISTFEFEEFHPESEELLSSNPKVHFVQRKETRL